MLLQESYIDFTFDKVDTLQELSLEVIVKSFRSDLSINKFE